MGTRVLYQLVLSPYCTKVRWGLEWKRLAYDAVEIDPFTRKEPRSASGQGKVPVLEDGGTVIADSTRILAYLEEAYPDRSLIPRQPAARASVLALEDWADEVFIPDLIAFKIFSADNPRRMVVRTAKHHPPSFLMKLQVLVGPAVVRSLGRSRRRGRSLSQIRSDYERHLDLLDSMASGRPYLTGEGPTVFDAAVWGGLWSMKGMAGEELLGPRLNLSGWFRRMQSEI